MAYGVTQGFASGSLDKDAYSPRCGVVVLVVLCYRVVSCCAVLFWVVEACEREMRPQPCFVFASGGFRGPLLPAASRCYFCFSRAAFPFVAFLREQPRLFVEKGLELFVAQSYSKARHARACRVALTAHAGARCTFGRFVQCSVLPCSRRAPRLASPLLSARARR